MRRDHGGAPGVRIDASVNTNPFGPPAALDSVFARTRELAGRYPEIDAATARDAWARKQGVVRERLLVGNGASELISAAIRALAPQRVIVFDPCYSEYASAGCAVGADVAHVPLDLDADAWNTPAQRLLDHGVDGVGLSDEDVVIVGHPNNPTGHFTAVADLLRLTVTGAHVLVDESFLALAGNADEAGRTAWRDCLSLISHVGAGVSVVASLTKTYAVPGLRLGVFVAEERLVEKISSLRDPWSVNGIAAEAAVVLAGDDGYLFSSCGLIAAERARMADTLESLGLRVTAGVAPWVLAELPEPHTATALRRDLLSCGIAIRDASTFPGLSPRWVRIGVRTPEENRAVEAAIASALGAA